MTTGAEHDWEGTERRGWPRWLWLVAAMVLAVVGGVVVGRLGGGDRELDVDESDQRAEANEESAEFEVVERTTYTSIDATTVVAPTPDGGAWVGTHAAGLLRWNADGDGYDRLLPGGASESGPLAVSALAVGDDGAVWTAPALASGSSPHTSGMWVGRYDGGEWTTWSTEDGLAEAPVESLALDEDGVVWAATFNGVSRFDGNEWTTDTTSDGLPHDRVTAVTVDGDGAVWALTQGRPSGSGERIGAVARFDDDEWTAWATGDVAHHVEADELPGDGVHALATAPDGAIWAATDAHLLRFDGREWQVEAADVDELGDVGPRGLGSLAVDHDGTVWLATPRLGPQPQGGVARRKDGEWHVHTHEDGLPHDEVTSLSVADDGSVWAATARGAARFRDGRWQSYTTGEGPAGDRTASLAVDGDGALWAGFHAGLSRFDGSGWTTWSADDGLARVTSLAIDDDDVVWAGTQDGLSRFDGTGWTTQTLSEESGRGLVASVAVSDDAVWVATWDPEALSPESGANRAPEVTIARFDGSEWTTWTADDLPSDGLPTMLEVDHAGTVWVAVMGAPPMRQGEPGNPDGVWRFDGDEWTAFTGDDGLPSDHVMAVAVDGATVWAGTGEGIARFDGQQWVSAQSDHNDLNLEDSDPPAHGPVSALAVDDEGVLWASVANTLSRFDGWSWATADDGSFPSATSMAVVGDTVWVGTHGGLVRYDIEPAGDD